MHLTKEEETMLEGEHGWANQISMKILVRLGELYGATRLIPVQSAHLSGVSYKHMGDASIDFLTALARGGGRAQTVATLNPSSFDPSYLLERYTYDRFKKQERIIGLYSRMGINPTLTCTPYYLQNQKPRQGEHLAWAESSAVIYANSVLRAWTNREGSPSALAAALIGKTPDYGVHQAANRQPNVLVKVKTSLKNEAQYGALGIHLGKTLKDRVPLVEGLRRPSDDDLKQLGAGMASSGMTTLFHTSALSKRGNLEEVSVEARDIEEQMASLCTTTEAPDLVFLGCPHCSLSEVKKVAHALEGKKVHKDIELWVCTSKQVKERAENYVDIIERAGGHVLCDTCVLVSWVKDLGMRTLLTNSAKTAFYAPNLNEVETRLVPLKQCVEIACTLS
jgi:predicted aconitase